MTKGGILAASLHPTAAFSFATLAFITFESNQLGVTSYTVNTEYSDKIPVTFTECLTMLIIDILYFPLLTWYFIQIWPSEFGTQKPCNFFSLSLMP